MNLHDLNVYNTARNLSKLGWKVVQGLRWQEQNIIGNQYIRSIDSIGANIAEGFGRFHYLDKNRFFYNARGSLQEAIHWVDLLYERSLIDENEYQLQRSFLFSVLKMLNALIKSTLGQVR